MYVALLYILPIETYYGLQQITFLNNIFKNDAQMDALKPTLIRNDVEKFIKVTGDKIHVASARYTNRIRANAKVFVFIPDQVAVVKNVFRRSKFISMMALC